MGAAKEQTMRRKVMARDWRFPRRMTRKQWSVLPYAERHAYVAQAQCDLLGYWRDCATARCRRALPLSASLLLGSQAGHDAGGMGGSGCGLPAIAGAVVARIAEGFGGAVAVLKRGG
jgi:hypothetical protein